MKESFYKTDKETILAGVVDRIYNDEIGGRENHYMDTNETLPITEEELIQGSDTGVLCIKRDNRGVVIINSKARGSGTVNLDINLADGVYKDRAHNIKFNVKNGKLSGKIKAKTVAVIY